MYTWNLIHRVNIAKPDQSSSSACEGTSVLSCDLETNKFKYDTFVHKKGVQADYCLLKLSSPMLDNELIESSLAFVFLGCFFYSGP